MISDKTPSILIVDDEDHILDICKICLKEKLGMEKVVVAKDSSQALAKFINQEFDYMIVDLHLPKISGLQLIKRVIQENYIRPSRIILFSGALQEDSILKASKLGVTNIISKPFNVKTFVEALIKAMKAKKTA